MKELYERTVYLNRNIEYLFNDEIIEYDIKSAGFSIIKQFNLLDVSKIKYLEGMEKNKRNRLIGLYVRDDKELGKTMVQHMRETRGLFFKENKIEDDDVLSIKNDAIFLINKRCNKTEFDQIKFVPKSEYTSYMYLNKIEFLFNKDNVDVKGLNDQVISLHKNYMLDIMTEFVSLMVNSDSTKQLKFINEICSLYRKQELDVNYYREMSKQSLFRPLKEISFINSVIGYTEYNGDISQLDISYNYTNYLIPMFRILI